jgi:heme/copper-type cytochrome/quinol oxidase subunit 3
VRRALAPAHAFAMETETSTGLNNRKTVFWAFLGSECMFFASLISTYLVYKGRSVTGPYPTEILDIPVTSISTFDLLTSSLSMVLCLAAIERGDIKKFQFWLSCVIVGGLIFLGFQVYEFTNFVHEGLTLSKNLFGSSFFVLTGFHGTHVAVGVLWLISLLVLSLRGNMSKADALDVEIAGLYWHFVDIVWIIIFTVVYLLE